MGDRHSGDGSVRAAIFADKTAGVGEDFAAGGGVEAASVAVLDAGVGGERSGLGAARVVDALVAGEGVDVFVEEIEVVAELAEAAGFGESGEGIFGGDA